jgi:hypothetical protein
MPIAFELFGESHWKPLIQKCRWMRISRKLMIQPGDDFVNDVIEEMMLRQKSRWDDQSLSWSVVELLFVVSLTPTNSRFQSLLTGWRSSRKQPMYSFLLNALCNSLFFFAIFTLFDPQEFSGASKLCKLCLVKFLHVQRRSYTMGFLHSSSRTHEAVHVSTVTIVLSNWNVESAALDMKYRRYSSSLGHKYRIIVAPKNLLWLCWILIYFTNFICAVDKILVGVHYRYRNLWEQYICVGLATSTNFYQRWSSCCKIRWFTRDYRQWHTLKVHFWLNFEKKKIQNELSH